MFFNWGKQIDETEIYPAVVVIKWDFNAISVLFKLTSKVDMDPHLDSPDSSMYSNILKEKNQQQSQTG